MADLKLRIDLQDPRPVYESGSLIRGHVTITSADGPWKAQSAELLLFWRTSGIGTVDQDIAHTIKICAEDAQIPTHFSREFNITLPLHPNTYIGKLIKINWYLGLYIKRGWLSKDETEIELAICPAASRNDGAIAPG